MESYERLVKRFVYHENSFLTKRSLVACYKMMGKREHSNDKKDNGFHEKADTNVYY